MNNGESNNNNINGIPNGTPNGNNSGGGNAKPNKPRRSRAAAGRNVPALMEQNDLAQLLQPAFMPGGTLTEANNIRNGRKRPHSALDQQNFGAGCSSSSSGSANNNSETFTPNGREMFCANIDGDIVADIGQAAGGFQEFVSPICSRPMTTINSASVGNGSQHLASTSAVGLQEFVSPIYTRPMSTMNSESVGNGSHHLASTSAVGLQEFVSPIRTLPMSAMNSASVGIGSQHLASTSAVGLQGVPEHIRDAVCRVNARQMLRMVDVHPPYAADVPSTGENGLSNLTWLLLDWAEEMIMQRVVGIVAAAGPFRTQGNLEGFDVRLVFNSQDGQELALHAWGELSGRLAGLKINDVVEFFRLKVRGQCKYPKGSFPYVLLFNGESRCQLLSRAGSSVISPISACEGNGAPIVVESIEWSGAVAEQLLGGQRSAESPTNVAHVGISQNAEEEEEEEEDEAERANDSDQNDAGTTVS